jgi:hypothetical protein
MITVIPTKENRVREAGFIPGESPPEVRTAMVLSLMLLDDHRIFENFCSRLNNVILAVSKSVFRVDSGKRM